MRKIFLLLVSLSIVFLSKATDISLTSASGSPGNEVEITASIADPSGATALEMDVRLPDGVTLVPSSISKVATTGHSLNGDVKNGTLKVLMHSFALEALPEGPLFKFKLRLGNQPGSFALTPTVVLSDSKGSKMETTVSSGSVTTLAPLLIVGNATVDFGRVAIKGSYSRAVSLLNSGNQTLTVTGLKLSSEDFKLTQQLPLDIQPGGSATLNVVYSPLKRSEGITEILSIESNSVGGTGKVSLLAVPYSVNELHVAEALAGYSDETVTVRLRLNNMEEIKGIQVEFKLPAALRYVEGSARGIGRGAAMSVTGSTADNALTLIAYTLSGSGITEGNDPVLEFDIRLDGSSGSYYLSPENVLLSNSELENMTSGTSGQYIRINAPTISVPASLNFGNVAVGAPASATLSVYNAGQAPLVIDRIELTDAAFSHGETLPLTIEQYETRYIPLTITPGSRGAKTAMANIYSNDPQSRLKTVNLSATAFESNQLVLNGEPNDDYTAYTFHFGLDNYTNITALQMDVRWLDGMTTSNEDFLLSQRCTDHSCSVASMGNGIYRIILFSMTNAPFSGNEGELFALTFHGTGFTNTTLSAENIILSTPDGQNFTSPGASITIVPVAAVKVADITLSSSAIELKVAEETRLTATVSPSNAEIKTVSWSSSNPDVATVTREGVITALSIGEAVVTATANDDSGVRRQCTVKVVPTPAESIHIEAEGATTMKATETLRLVATVLPETTTDKTVRWKSGNPEVAQVDQSGTVTAVSVGTAVIMATNSAGQTDEITIEVVPTPVESIELNRTSAEIKVSGGFCLVATVSPATATDKSVQWTSSNPSVVAVDDDGNITGLAIGLATITCSAKDGSGRSATCEVRVAETPAESISIIAEGETTLKVTETVKLSATVLPETTTDKSVSWMSENPSVATVDTEGTVTAVEVGETDIIATNSAGQTDRIKITVVETPVEEIGIFPETVTLKVTESELLTATVLPLTATNKTLSWSSSSPAIATVSPNGLVTAQGLGNVVITAAATDGSQRQATCTVTVVPTPAQSVTITADGTPVLRATETLRLTATVLPATTTDKSVTWSSANPDVATVDQYGLVTAVSVGETEITVTNSAGQTDSITVTVRETPVSEIRLNYTEYSLKATQTVKLVPTVLPATATDKNVEWASNDQRVALVGTDGTVTAVTVGQTTITARATDGSNSLAFCEITVVPTIAESVIISTEGETTLKVPGLVKLNATVYPSTTTDPSVTWTSENPAVATVDPNGLVTAVAVGSTRITVKDSAGNTDTILITVAPTLVESILLDNTSKEIKETETFRLLYTVFPENATNKEVVFTSSDPKVTSVDNMGNVSGVKVGQAVIYCAAADESGVAASCEVTVVAMPAESITVKADGVTTIRATETVQLTATVLPETATDKSVTWNTDHPEVASVNADGLVTGLSVGTATITATNSAGQTDEIEITVVPTPISKIEISRNSAVLKAAQTLALGIVVIPETATDKSVAWSSDNEEVVVVSQQGEVTAVAPGTATVKVMALDGSETIATCVITVIPTPAESISVKAEGPTTLKATETVRLTATVLPETTTDKSVHWTSSNSAIATVDDEGTVTAEAVGEAVITATNSSGQTDEITITVVPTPVASITLNRPAVTLKATENFALSATVMPATATNPNLEWSSSEPAVATVDSKGVVTALEVGQATIKARATDGSNAFAVCQVTVAETAAERITVKAEGSTTLKATGTVQLTATVLPATTTDKSVIWTSDNPGVATVSDKGLVTAMAVGLATVTATNSAGQKDGITIVVEPTPVAEIRLNRAQSAIKVETGFNLNAVVLPETATDKSVRWSSTQPDVVSVDSEGNVRGLRLGTATIRCEALDGSGVWAECVITVGETAAESITVEAHGPTTLKATQTVQLTATVLPATTTDKTVSWNSDNTDVAAVSASGLVTAIGVGSAVITATNSAGQTDRITITVEPTSMESIKLSRTEATLRVPQTLKLEAEVFPATTTVKTLRWSSSNPDVASVSQDGTVAALGIGNAVITAESTDGSRVEARCEVTVEPTPAESVTISTDGPTLLKATQTVQLSAAVMPETTTDKTVSWSSDNTAVATVSETGLVTANSVGVAVITATNSAGQTDRITITVEETPVTSITLNRNSVTLRVEEGFKLTASIMPVTATNKNHKWESSEPSVVSVDDEGYIRALALGQATVSCTAMDGSGVRAECKVTVEPTVAESVAITAEGPTTLKAEETVQLTATVLPETTTDKSVGWSSDNTAVATVSDTGLVTARAVGTATVTATNSAGQKDEIIITVVETPVASIALSQTQATLKATQTVQLTASVLPTTATNKTLTWTTSDERVATVSPEGTVTAVGVGEAIITASATDGSGVKAECVVTVEPTPAESISISARGTTTLKATQTVQLVSTVLPETTTDKTVTWTSGSPETATVSDTGLVTAHAVGTALITATNSAGQTADIEIRVVETPVSKITIQQQNVSLKESETIRLTTEVLPATATDKTLRWTSTSPGVAAVTQEGVVTAMSVGEATIFAMATDGSNVSAQCHVTVVETPAESITVATEGSTTLQATQTLQLTATVLPATTTDKTVTWSSDSPEVASVADSGLVTANSVGTAVITAMNSAGQTDSIEITVAATPVASITLNYNEATLRATETLALTPAVFPETATDKTLVWTSSDDRIANVTQNGLVTAKAVGTTRISVMAADGSNVKAECEITVEPTPAESVTIEAVTSTTLKATQTVQLVATVLPETATDKTVSWSSDNTAVATVSDTGLVTAHAVGTATVTATNSAGGTDSVEITVVETPVEAITLNRTEASLQVNQGFRLMALISPSTATDKTTVWSSSDPAVATVDGDGNVAGVSIGQAVVTCSAADGSGVSAQCVLNVVPTPSESISITAMGETTLKATETLQLKATVLPEDATDKSVGWSSGSPEVATVDRDGLVTAVSVGEAVITATNSSGQTDRITITVVPTPVAAITLDKTTVVLKAKETVAINAMVLPATATDKRLEWVSDDTDIAIVNQDGIVTAIAVGTAVVTVKALDGHGASVTCGITVEETPAESITVSADGPTTLTEGETVRLTASILPETTTDKSVFWQSQKPEVAAVDQSGTVTALSEGETVIFATNSGGLRGQITITVLKRIVEPEGVRILTPSPLTMKPGETLLLVAEVYPEESTDKSILWESGDETVAKVDKDGTLRAIGEGTIEISAYDATGHSDSLTLTVLDDSGIDEIFYDVAVRVDVFNLTGVLMVRNATKEDVGKLEPGLYIINGRKYRLK